MTRNPIYEREKMAAARSLRFPLLLAAINACLFLFVLIRVYAATMQAQQGATVDYEGFMDTFCLAAGVEFIVVLVAGVAFSAGALSGEREEGTLELLLTTPLGPSKIIAGKLMTAMSGLGVLVFSSFPALMSCFIYGGLTLKMGVCLFAAYMVTAFFCVALGLLGSALFGHPVQSFIFSYVVLAFLTAGTYVMNRFVLPLMLAGSRMSNTLSGVEAQGAAGDGFLLLFMNPAVTFFSLLCAQTGGGRFGLAGGVAVSLSRVYAGLAAQLAAAVFMVFVARRLLMDFGERRTDRRG